MKKVEPPRDSDQLANAKVLHDLKAPLNMLTLHLELIRRRLASGESAEVARADESIEIMKREVLRLDRMLHELLGQAPGRMPGGDAAADRPRAT